MLPPAYLLCLSLLLTLHSSLSSGTIPDFLEMSAPAVMPDSMRPDWLGEDAWVSQPAWEESEAREGGVEASLGPG
jgi:hypothetical protein